MFSKRFHDPATSKTLAYEQAGRNGGSRAPAGASALLPPGGQRSPSQSGGVGTNAEQLTPKSASALNRCVKQVGVTHFSSTFHRASSFLLLLQSQNNRAAAAKCWCWLVHSQFGREGRGWALPQQTPVQLSLLRHITAGWGEGATPMATRAAEGPGPECFKGTQEVQGRAEETRWGPTCGSRPSSCGSISQIMTFSI